MSKTNWNSHCALAENSSNTEIKVDQATYAWTINNFSYFEELGNDIHSATFTAATNPKVKWSIRLVPKANPSNSYSTGQGYIGLHLNFSEKSEEKEVLAKYSFSIFNEDGERFTSASSKQFHKFNGTNFTSGWDHFLTKDVNFRERVLPKNILRVHCEVIFPQKKVISEHHLFPDVLFLRSAMAECESPGILDILLETHLLSDIVISVETKEFPAHKAILAARSKIFCAMFQHDTKENQLNRVDIEDIKEEVFGEMLQFIYTGRCEKLDELAMDLYIAADKYDLDLLKIFCIEALFRNLSVENVVQSLILADTYSTTEFKSEVIKFIVANANQVFDTDDWQMCILINPRLSQEVFRAMARQLDCGGDL